MLAVQRRNLILEYLKMNKTASIGQLEELTGASPATLRRDLSLLEDQGLLRKTRGGAQSPSPCSLLDDMPDIPSSINYSSLPWESDPYLACKDAIARRALDFISPGDILFVGAGMTCNLLCRYLCREVQETHLSPLTVVTTNITAVMELAANPHIRVLVLGGSIHRGPNHIETLDQYTLQTLKSLYFHKVFFTVDGIDSEEGYSIINREQVPLYRHLLGNARESYLLASQEKFGRRAFTRLCGLGEIPHVIAGTQNIEEDYQSCWAEQGVQVHFAS